MLMATETTGNLALVREALSPAPTSPELLRPITEWCMVVARPGMEHTARDALRRHGVGAYWPNFVREVMVEDRRNGGRMRSKVLTPVISGIIFSPAKFTDHFWNALDLAPGAVNVVRNGHADIAILNDVDIVVIHKIEAGLNRPPNAKPTKPLHDFTTGEKVKLVDDVLNSWGVGKVVKLYKDGRITTEFDRMGRKLSVTVLPYQIKRL